MSVPVYMIQSDLGHAREAGMMAWMESIGSKLGDKLELVSVEEWRKLPFALLSVASGGSENLFLNHLYDETRTAPYLILTSGDSNSLAASMEILSFLRQHGKEGEILHGSVDYIAQRIDVLRHVYEVRAWMKDARLGCIGAPSDWLIASGDNDAALSAKLGASFVKINIQELMDEYTKMDFTSNQWTEQLQQHAFDKNEMHKALCLYGAMKRLVEKYALNAVSVRCFDMLDTACTTGCLALAILNAEGIYAGCEGDMPTLLTMTLLGKLSGRPVFMCNPSRINVSENEMILAHCTLPLDMPKDYTLMTHYESDSGIALRGRLREGTYTLFKTDHELKRFMVQKAELLENLSEATLCRTQLRMKIEDAQYFLKNPINNHHTVCEGDYTEVVKAFFATLE